MKLSLERKIQTFLNEKENRVSRKRFKNDRVNERK